MLDMSENFSQCKKAAIKLLTKRDYSQYKLTQKLMEKEHDIDTINQVITYLTDKQLFREDYYIEARIRGLIRKNYGPSVIQYKLEQEEIFCSTEFINNIYLEIDMSQDQQIAHLVRKKAMGASELSFEQQMKILRFLNSKGHQIHNISKYLEN